MIQLTEMARVTVQFGTVKITEFTVEELRGLYTMCQNIPTPSIGSRETVQALGKLQSIVGAAYCRDCKRPGIYRNNQGHMVCEDHKP